MIFMRDLVTSKLGQCQVNTRFAIACLYKDVNEIHDELKVVTHKSFLVTIISSSFIFLWSS